MTLSHGFLIRVDRDGERIEVELAQGGARVDVDGWTVVVAGDVDADRVLHHRRDGGELESPAATAAIAIWDGRSKSLALVRDRTGLHPLFHTIAGRNFVASTDARALRMLPGVSSTPDPLSLAAWICGVDVEPDRTLIGGLRRVPAGHVFTWSPDRSRLASLWRSPASGDLPASAAAQFGEVLEAAILSTPETRAAVFLSGGLDSSAILAAVSRTSHERAQQDPLALCVEIEGAREDHMQIGVANGLNVRRIVRAARSGEGLAQRGLDRAAGSLWPTGSVWQPVFDDLAADARAAGVTTIFDGLGGDELLDAALAPAAGALRRGQIGVLRNLVEAERAYAGGGWRSVLGAGIRSPRRWSAPPYIQADHRAALVELAATPRDDLLSSGLVAAWEETWDSGFRQGVSYRHPLWDAEVVHLVRGLPVHALVAGGDAKSPARSYLAATLPAIAGRWPRPAVADLLAAALEREALAARPELRDFRSLREMGVLVGEPPLGRFALPLYAAMLWAEELCGKT